jgi:hypothetical protein
LTIRYLNPGGLLPRAERKSIPTSRNLACDGIRPQDAFVTSIDLWQHITPMAAAVKTTF